MRLQMGAGRPRFNLCLERHIRSSLGYFSVNNGATKFVATTAVSRRLSFSGREWTVKSGNELKPGPNNWSDSVDNVWVDDSGQLHLRITHRNGRWYSAEVATLQLLGFGRYAFYLS